MGGMEEMRRGIWGGPWCMWRPPREDSRTDMLGERRGGERRAGGVCFSG